MGCWFYDIRTQRARHVLCIRVPHYSVMKYALNRELSTVEGPRHVYKYKTGCWDSGDKPATLTYRQTKFVSTVYTKQHNERVNHRKILVNVSAFPINDVSAFPVNGRGVVGGGVWGCQGIFFKVWTSLIKMNSFYVLCLYF